jgi:hypothetical protein
MVYIHCHMMVYIHCHMMVYIHCHMMVYIHCHMGAELTKDKHYWEVELLPVEVDELFIGISRLNLNPTEEYWSKECTDPCLLAAGSGALCGNGKNCDDMREPCKQGDRVGVLLNLDDVFLRFFKNGLQHGPGYDSYAAGSVTGPVVAAVLMYCEEDSMRLLPNAQQPEYNSRRQLLEFEYLPAWRGGGL